MESSATIRFVGKVERAEDISSIRIYPEFCQALLGVEAFSHLIVLYWMHLRDDDSHRGTLQVVPRRHEGAPLSGVFACRSPSRPNPIGHSVVRLEGMDGCRVYVSGLDALAESPIIDIKPYHPRGDSIPEAVVPEWTERGPPT